MPSPTVSNEAPGNTHEATAREVLGIAQRLADELHARGEPGRRLSLDSSLDRDAGLDSLARMELTLRLERTFEVKLPEDLFAAAETPRDLALAILGASAASSGVAPPRAAEAPLPEADALPGEAGSLVGVLSWHVQRHPDRPHIHLYGQAGREHQITYADLWRAASTAATGLQKRDVNPGHTVAIMLPTGPGFFHAFFAALLVGAVPVPIYPPARLSQIEEHVRRQAGILSNAQARILISDESVRQAARLLRLQVAGLRAVVTVAELSEAGAASALPVIHPSDTALLQYTSGSTGNPKGVVLTHANLLANIRAMGKAAQARSTDVFVSWLPLYHDMGLIGAWLGSLYHAALFVCMSPVRFLGRPEHWLWAIHRHRGTLSAAPNFGYELCVRRIDDAALEGLDLSSWRLAFNGAESVSPDTVTQFAHRFAKYGLLPEAMAPVYGLAESSVGLAFPPLGRKPLIDRIQRTPFTRRGEAVPAAEDEPDPLRFVACGQPLAGHEIRVVDTAGRELGDRREGRLEFRGPSAASGYYRNPDATRRLVRRGWLDSGDMAYVAEGEVYITGRAKDLIIRAGRNLYPFELEEAVGNLSGIRKGCVAVFASKDERSGTERLVILAETRETDPAIREALKAQIQGLAVELAGTPADDVVLAAPHTVLKTSSGKIRRAASREFYERGGAVHRAVWWQLLRLALGSFLPRWRRAQRLIADGLYAAYLWGVFWLLAPTVWLVVAVLPRPPWARRALRAAARLALWLSYAALRVRGLDHLPRQGGYVMVANHASYLDGIVLSAALPVAFSFVAKKELERSFVSRIFLQHIGSRFVERFDPRQGVEDASRVLDVIRGGTPVLFFPEGTFLRMPGLLPFRMGAFAAAADQNVPVLPVALNGTRSMLRSGQWFPRRSALTVTIGQPLFPEGSDWSAAVKLRDAARSELLKYCGEPELRGGGGNT
jgi:1-acyl-sn-glycerol-3-phosphate acyltransferase